MPGRYPGMTVGGLYGVSGIERRLESVGIEGLQLELMNEMIDRRQHNIRRKR